MIVGRRQWRIYISDFIVYSYNKTKLPFILSIDPVNAVLITNKQKKFIIDRINTKIDLCMEIHHTNSDFGFNVTFRGEKFRIFPKNKGKNVFTKFIYKRLHKFKLVEEFCLFYRVFFNETYQTKIKGLDYYDIRDLSITVQANNVFTARFGSETLFMKQICRFKTLTEDEDAVRELLPLYELKKKKYFIHLLGYSIANRNVFLVFEYYQNGSLRSNIASLEDRFSTIYEIVIGVWHLHRYGFIHRDIKPENILIDKEGRSHLCDFGLSRSMGGEFTRDVGTFKYIAPEVMDSSDYDFMCDIYSLGVVIYEILSGSIEDIESFIRGNHHIEGTEVGFNVLIRSMLSTNPNDRPTIYEIIIFIFKCREFHKGFLKIIFSDKNLFAFNDFSHYCSRAQNVFGIGMTLFKFMNHPDANDFFKLGSLCGDKHSLYTFMLMTYLGETVALDCGICIEDLITVVTRFHYEELNTHLVKKIPSIYNSSSIGSPIDKSFKSGVKTCLNSKNKEIFYYSINHPRTGYLTAYERMKTDIMMIKIGRKIDHKKYNKEFLFFSFSSLSGLTKSQCLLAYLYSNMKGVAKSRYIEYYFCLLSKSYHQLIDLRNKDIKYHFHEYDQQISKVPMYVCNITHYNVFELDTLFNCSIHNKIIFDRKDAITCQGACYSKDEFKYYDPKVALKLFIIADSNENVGFIYEKGIGTEKNHKLACEYYEKEGKGGLKCFYKICKDPEKKERIFKDGLNEGISYFQVRMFERLIVDKIDLSNAWHYLTFAFNQKDQEAVYYVAMCHYYGYIVRKDVDKAISLLEAIPHHFSASFKLGMIYINGIYREHDVMKAKSIFDEANIDVTYFIPKVSLEKDEESLEYFKFDDDFFLKIFCKQFLKHEDSIEKLIEVQNPIAMLIFADRIEETNRNYAIQLLTRSSEMEEIDSFFNLFWMTGEFSYISKAAKLGDPVYQYIYGIDLFFGNDVEENTEEGVFWIKQSSFHDEIRHADIFLSSFYFYGLGCPKNIDKAMHHFSKAQSIQSKSVWQIKSAEEDIIEVFQVEDIWNEDLLKLRLNSCIY